MKRLLIQFLLASLSANLAVGLEQMYKINNLTVNTMANNPFTGDWSCEVFSPGDATACKVPIKKDLPDTMRVKGTFEFMGDEMVSFDLTVCEALEKESAKDGIREIGLPKGQFPTQCPVKAGMDYATSKHKIPKEKIPPGGVPDGDYSGEVHMYEPGKDPYASVYFEGVAFHELPKLPKHPGLGR
ncbi:uncharacterized protein LOC130673088 [Microplitis mediator]|uniref:uncharacterized protein LOC130673088 n=1 Tax=Microplitis mediator TaxID=375433 RepID=UPI0025539AFD|nr:uncharacterized protein LOC130673088 [Microplitis mediator]